MRGRERRLHFLMVSILCNLICDEIRKRCLANFGRKGWSRDGRIISLLRNLHLTLISFMHLIFGIVSFCYYLVIHRLRTRLIQHLIKTVHWFSLGCRIFISYLCGSVWVNFLRVKGRRRIPTDNFVIIT